MFLNLRKLKRHQCDHEWKLVPSFVLDYAIQNDVMMHCENCNSLKQFDFAHALIYEKCNNKCQHTWAIVEDNIYYDYDRYTIIHCPCCNTTRKLIMSTAHALVKIGEIYESINDNRINLLRNYVNEITKAYDSIIRDYNGQDTEYINGIRSILNDIIEIVDGKFDREHKKDTNNKKDSCDTNDENETKNE